VSMGTRAAASQAVIEMPPESPIVCAVDASSAARRAARLAGALAAEIDAPLILAHAVAFSEPDDDDDGRDVDARARLAIRHRVAANVRRAVGDRQIELVSGDLERFANERDARLLIVGGPWWLSTDRPLAARCPVVVVSAPVSGDVHLPC
jgi:hypothetical protein